MNERGSSPLVHLAHFSDLPFWHLAPVEPRQKQRYPFLVNNEWQVRYLCMDNYNYPKDSAKKDYGKENCFMNHFRCVILRRNDVAQAQEFVLPFH